MNARHRTLLAAVFLVACDTGNPVSVDLDSAEPHPRGIAAARQLAPGAPTALTGSGDDWWPRIEGDHLAWYRSAPAAEQGLWRADLRTGESEHVWVGEVEGPFALHEGRVYWGASDALRVHDPISGAIEVLSDQWADYAWIDVSDRYVTGVARVGSRRPIHIDRATGEEVWIPTPTAVPAAHGWGDYLSWTDRRDGFRIAQHYVLHIPTGTEVRATDQGELLSAGNAELAGGRLAYFDRRFCPGSVAAFDIVSGTTTAVDLGVDCPTVAALQDDLLVTFHVTSWPTLALRATDLGDGASATLSLTVNDTRRVDADLDGTRVVYTTADGLVLVDLAPPPLPVANAGGPYRGVEGSDIVLDASASTAGVPGGLAFAWDFGDGTSGGGASVEHAWGDDGDYTAVVSVTDALGRTVSAEAPVDIQNAPPRVEASPFVRTAAAPVEVGQPIVLRPAFSDPGTDDAPWGWTVYAGGEVVASGSVEAQGALPEVGWVPESAGEWTVEIEVVDADGDAGRASLLVQVIDPVPESWVARIQAGNGPNHAAPAAHGNGLLPVVIHGSEELAGHDLDPASFRAGPGQAEPVAGDGGLMEVSDVDGDGFDDVRLRFRMQDTGLAPGDVEVCVEGTTTEGGSVLGCGAVRIGGR